PAPAQPTAGPVAPTSLNSLVPPGPPPPMVGAAPPQSTTRPAGGASVSVEALAPPTVAPGQPLPFEIIVRNAWTLSAGQVRVELPLPPGARFLAGDPKPEVKNDSLSWLLGNLEPGAERRLKGEIQPGPGDGITFSPSVSYVAAAGLNARI